MSDTIWVPPTAREEEKPASEIRQVGEQLPDDETFPVTLCGGPYGDTKETGMPVRVAIGATERHCFAAAPESRMIHTKRGKVQRVIFAPTSVEGIWRPREGSGDEVPN